MKFEEFKSGEYRQQYQYKSFLPEKINHEWTWGDPRVNVMLEKATKTLGELNAFTLIVPDVDLFIRMHVIKEANTSSRIEGTRTEMDEVVLDEQEVIPERRDDWGEVQNYIRAMNTSIDELKRLPLSLRLLRKAHATLMSDVRGEKKTPGEFRRSQNWIGGASLSDAVYIPPHNQDMPELLSDMEAFWHNEHIQVPHLIRIAISHYQFETIHPFLDGNGRIGRLLITLYLVSHGLLAQPSLYLSAHLEKHRGAYYDALTRVRESNDMGHWCRFFLQAVSETAENGKQTFQRILVLRQDLERQIVTLGRRAKNGRRLISYLYEHPAVTINQVMELLNIQFNPASNLITSLIDMGILKEITGQRRNRVFLFEPYFKIFADEESEV
ncbi:MAG: Fic family protein [Deltaproteobacteria bacterium]|nr:Fic family protein [Deltaproteobacteria bacterium]MBW2145184.1 Fic family protein [Deltaproteobacteria bacterium]